MGLMGFGAAWDLGRAIAGATRRATRDRYATVTRRDLDGVTWGVVAGASGEVPLGGSLADAEVGDVVAVDWRGGVPVASGNATSPSVGARQVEGAVAPVRAASVAAQGAARAARSVADAAQKVAEAVNQHFWTDSSGVHVTQVTQDQWEDSEGEGYHSGPNVLINALGQLFRDGLNNLLALVTGATTGVAIYDGQGNEAANVVASFTSDGQTIGRESESHTTVDYHSMTLIDKEQAQFFSVIDERLHNGWATVSTTFVANGLEWSWTLPLPARSQATTSVTVNGTSTSFTLEADVHTGELDGVNLGYDNVPAKGAVVRVTYQTDSALCKSMTFGSRAGDTGPLSVAEGRSVQANGIYSHAEGIQTKASGYAAHAEGVSSNASGEISHAEGDATKASGRFSHAEGWGTTAGGDYAHAEGYNASATGDRSHAQNEGTIAASDNQTVIGQYNASDSSGNYALIVGNGLHSSARSNALSVSWDGMVNTRSRSHAGTERPTSNTPLQKIDSYDSEGASVGYAQIVLTGGGVYRSYAVQNPTTGEAVALYLRAYDNGTKQLTLSSGATIADSAIPTLAIGTKTSGTLARDRGGTGVTAKQASSVTLNNSAATTNHAWHNGVLATVTLGALHLTSALADSSNRNIGTVPSGYRPSDSVWIVGGTNANASTGKVFIAIASSGAITLYNRSGASLGTGVNMYFTATYAI